MKPQIKNVASAVGLVVLLGACQFSTPVVTQPSPTAQTILQVTAVMPTATVSSAVSAPSPTSSSEPTSLAQDVPALVLLKSLSYQSKLFVYSPDGHYIVTRIPSSDILGIQLIEINTDKIVWTSEFPADSPVLGEEAVAFSSDGSRIAAGGLEGIIYLVDAHDGKVLKKRKLTDSIATLAFEPDGGRVIAGSCNSNAGFTVWNIENTSVTTYPVGVCGGAMAISPIQSLIAVGNLSLVNYETGSIDPISSDVSSYAVAFSPDGGSVATEQDGSLVIWNLTTRVKADWLDWKNYQTDIIGAAWSSHNALALLSSNGKIVVWNMNNQKILGYATLPGAEKVDFSPDGSQLAAFGSNLDKPIAPVTIWHISN